MVLPFVAVAALAAVSRPAKKQTPDLRGALRHAHPMKG
jgi:hypothetical protein